MSSTLLSKVELECKQTFTIFFAFREIFRIFWLLVNYYQNLMWHLVICLKFGLPLSSLFTLSFSLFENKARNQKFLQTSKKWSFRQILKIGSFRQIWKIGFYFKLQKLDFLVNFQLSDITSNFKNWIFRQIIQKFGFSVKLKNVDVKWYLDKIWTFEIVLELKIFVGKHRKKFIGCRR